MTCKRCHSTNTIKTNTIKTNTIKTNTIKTNVNVYKNRKI